MVPAHITEKFWAKLPKRSAEECWEWVGAKKDFGYGVIVCKQMKRSYMTHRVAYIATIGDIPEGQFVCHKCDNPPCCNPAHLFLGSPQDNSRDCQKKGRANRGKNNGRAKLSDDDVRKIRSSKACTSAKELAAQYGVTHQLVHMIWGGKVWRHILN